MTVDEAKAAALREAWLPCRWSLTSCVPESQIKAMDDAVAAMIAENERLRGALRQSEAWFREYEVSHRAKADAEEHKGRKAASHDKADRNKHRADFCARALLGGE